MRGAYESEGGALANDGDGHGLVNDGDAGGAKDGIDGNTICDPHGDAMAPGVTGESGPPAPRP
jgi:hypothetical protein